MGSNGTNAELRHGRKRIGTDAEERRADQAIERAWTFEEVIRALWPLQPDLYTAIHDAARFGEVIFDGHRVAKAGAIEAQPGCDARGFGGVGRVGCSAPNFPIVTTSKGIG